MLRIDRDRVSLSRRQALIRILAAAAAWGIACGRSPTQPPPTATLMVSVNPPSVVAGAVAQATITLSPASNSAATVSLSTSNGAATVPASVSIASGATTGTVNVQTVTVPAATAVTITASYAGVTPPLTATATLTVTPLPPPPSSSAVLTSLALSAARVVGGSPVQATVTLSGPAPSGGAEVRLSTNDVSGVLVSVPPTVTVPAGNATASFPISTREVGGTFQIALTASYGGVSASVTLAVDPAPPTAFVLVDEAGHLSPGLDIFVNTDQNRTNWLSLIPGEGFQAAYPPGQQFGFISIVLLGQTAPGSRPGRDFSAYRTMQLQLRGASGGEIVDVGIKDNTNPDDGGEVKQSTTVSSAWRTYTFTLRDFSRSDLKRIYVPLELVFSGTTARTIYFRDVRYVP